MRLMFAARAIGNTAGGVERMVVTIMNALAHRGHQVMLLTWDRSDAVAFYTIAENVSWLRLDMGDPNISAGPSLMMRRARRIRKIVRQFEPQCIACFQDGPYMSLRLYALGLGTRFIAAERNAPARFEHTSAGKRKRLIFNSFRFADRILVQCDSYLRQYPPYLQGRISTIPNPVFPAKLQARPDVPSGDGRFSLLSVGRLSYQKNYACLIEAFSRLAPEFPDWSLTIVGDGEERQRLAKLVAERGLNDRIVLVGTSNNVEEFYARAHLFVLPSRWEGFPNAMAEAMAHGLPCIGYELCAGVNDLIVDGKTGLLAKKNGDPDELSRALSVLMSAPAMRKNMGQSGLASMRDFEPERIFDRWEEVLKEVVCAYPRSRQVDEC